MKPIPRYCYFLRPLGRRLEKIYKLLRKRLKDNDMTPQLQQLKTQVEATIALQQQTITILTALVERVSNQDAPQDLVDLKTALETSTAALQATISTVPAV